jgi:hypothetical protein
MAKKAKKQAKRSSGKASVYSDNTRAMVAFFLLALTFGEFLLFTKYTEYILSNMYHGFMFLFVAQLVLVVYLLHLINRR